MHPTEILKNEHRAIEIMLRILGKVGERFEKGEAIDGDHAQQILEFFSVFADTCHHGKEEKLLFPTLEAFGIPNEGGPIGIMLHEHNLGRQCIANMKQALAQYRPGNREAAQMFGTNARSYISLLGQHIQKEDNILFHMAEMVLPESKQEELMQQFEEMEEKTVGWAKHEEYHRLIDKLRNIYLQ